MQPPTILPKLTDTTQTISFSEGDGVTCAEVYATNVVVTTNAGSHKHGSSKVKLKNLVDYNWDPKYYLGQLLAVHISGKYLAYSVKAPNSTNPGTWNGMVRVVYSPEPGTDRRTLIKGLRGEVQDLAFAHIQNQAVVASVDVTGHFYIHEIELTETGLSASLVVEVIEDTVIPSAMHRVVWCPYIPGEEDAFDDDIARLLLTTHGNVARMWNVAALTMAVGRGGTAFASAALEDGGPRTASVHTATIIAAAFSPDGSALATAAADGYVMFFQVYLNSNKNPRCLHKWQPHGGKPLSCLFFLDNHKNYNSDVQFWEFAVTGADKNTSIKIWTCKSWSCLQSITFAPQLTTEPSLMGLKAMLDSSASYLLLSDFRTRTLYVLNMIIDSDDSTACCKNISEFLLPYPVLSFCIADAEEEQIKCGSSCDDSYHRNGSDADIGNSPDDFDLHHEEEGGTECGGSGRRVCLRLYIVQPKGLQEGELVYTPKTNLLRNVGDLTLENADQEVPPSSLPSNILQQQQSQQLKNLLMRNQTQPGSLIAQRAESPTSIQPQLNLMTPDAFSSPGKREEEDPPLSVTPDVTNKPRASTSGSDEAQKVTNESKSPSGGSSPSLEVQQIMSHNDEPYYKDDIEESECRQTPEHEHVAGAVPSEPLYPAPEPYGAHDKLTKLTHSNSDTSWPQISLAQINEANQRKASSDKSSSLNATLNGSLSAPLNAVPPLHTQPPNPERISNDDESHSRLEALEQKIDKLTELMVQQGREVRGLRAEVRAPRDLLDEALREHTQRTSSAIETALTDGWERIARAGESASSRAAAAAGVGAARALEPLASALQHELAAKLSATDRLLRENIDKLVNSKTVMERLSTAIATSLSEMVRESFREALFDGVVPVMEKAHAQMFRQINQAFQNGSKEFAAKTEAAARAAAERGGAAGAEALRNALEKHAEALAASTAAAAQPDISATLREVAHSVLEKEVTWWREQARSVVVQMSRAHSPATPSSHHTIPDRQMQMAQIQSLISNGDVNSAFQLALSASDLALVVAACRALDPSRVFGPPCRLKQHVLLSLIQQLAADMQRDTQLKHRYLEEAIMNLDTGNSLTREHLPIVVQELQKQIRTFLAANPGHALTRQFRMLLMAADSLVKSTV